MKDAHEDVRKTEVHDEPLHARQLLTAQAQDDEHEDVAEERQVQDGGEHGNLGPGQGLVPLEVVERGVG